METERKRKIAIITGASSGLGREYVRCLDRRNAEYHDGHAAEPLYDEFWVIARRQERLEALQDEVRTPLVILPLDLTARDTVDTLSSLLQKQQPDVRMLISAAGFGKIGSCEEIPLQEADRMIDLNCRAAVDVTQVCIPFMGSGSHIMEICSTAAFQPLQYLNVYAASKAFLYRYSRALRAELWSRRILVTAVCPYWIGNTGFIPCAKSTSGADRIHSFPFSGRAEEVAERSLSDTMLGLSVSTPGIFCSIHRVLARLLPAELAMAGWELVRRL